METILSFLPKKLYEQLRGMTPMMIDRMEELRIRVGRPLEVIVGGDPYFFSYEVTHSDADQLLNQYRSIFVIYA